MSEREPAEVFCLAEFLAEEMLAREWTSVDVGVRMGATNADDIGKDILTVDFLLSIQDDGLVVSDETCGKLALAFGTSAEFFKNLHETWKRWPDRRVPFNAPESILSR